MPKQCGCFFYPKSDDILGHFLIRCVSESEMRSSRFVSEIVLWSKNTESRGKQQSCISRYQTKPKPNQIRPTGPQMSQMLVASCQPPIHPNICLFRVMELTQREHLWYGNRKSDELHIARSRQILSMLHKLMGFSWAVYLWWAKITPSPCL